MIKVTMSIEKIKDELGGEVLDSEDVDIEIYQGDLIDTYFYMVMEGKKYIVSRTELTALLTLMDTVNK
jgi:hypothetical protein